MTLAAEFETGGTIAPPPGPKIKPGSRLVREWHGRTHTVCVTQDGFEFQGQFYRAACPAERYFSAAPTVLNTPLTLVPTVCTAPGGNPTQ